MRQTLLTLFVLLCTTISFAMPTGYQVYPEFGGFGNQVAAQLPEQVVNYPGVVGGPVHIVGTPTPTAPLQYAQTVGGPVHIAGTPAQQNTATTSQQNTSQQTSGSYAQQATQQQTLTLCTSSDQYAQQNTCQSQCAGTCEQLNSCWMCSSSPHEYVVAPSPQELPPSNSCNYPGMFTQRPACQETCAAPCKTFNGCFICTAGPPTSPANAETPTELPPENLCTYPGMYTQQNTCNSICGTTCQNFHGCYVCIPAQTPPSILHVSIPSSEIENTPGTPPESPTDQGLPLPCTYKHLFETAHDCILSECEFKSGSCEKIGDCYTCVPKELISGPEPTSLPPETTIPLYVPPKNPSEPQPSSLSYPSFPFISLGAPPSVPQDLIDQLTPRTLTEQITRQIIMSLFPFNALFTIPQFPKSPQSNNEGLPLPVINCRARGLIDSPTECTSSCRGTCSEEKILGSTCWKCTLAEVTPVPQAPPVPAPVQNKCAPLFDSMGGCLSDCTTSGFRCAPKLIEGNTCFACQFTAPLQPQISPPAVPIPQTPVELPSPSTDNCEPPLFESWGACRSDDDCQNKNGFCQAKKQGTLDCWECVTIPKFGKLSGR